MHDNQEAKIDPVHEPVLVRPVLQYLAPEPGNRYLDLTAGYGGHAGCIIEVTGSPEKATLVDRDDMAQATLTEKFGKQGVELIHTDFLTASQALASEGRQYDIILADLGVSSPHLDIADRGFSYGQDGPLDMRMDRRLSLTAEVIVNTYSAESLAEILRSYGEEPRARKIAGLIVEHRPFHSTAALAQIVKRAYPGHSRTHPATRTFQALRIAVNNELGLLTEAIPLWVKLLAPGGRLGIISFHSLEDRIVKDAFRDLAGDRFDAELRNISKRPIVADEQELVFNPRSRSSKLRVVSKPKK